MSNYNLKDKIHINKEFLDDLTVKSWQEIEYLQSQISNIEVVTEQDKALVKLLNTLLTSYYIFTGGLESLTTDDYASSLVEPEISLETQDISKEGIQDNNIHNDIVKVMPKLQISDSTDIEYEPFEYFVDFDDPIGEQLTDEDLYGN